MITKNDKVESEGPQLPLGFVRFLPGGDKVIITSAYEEVIFWDVEKVTPKSPSEPLHAVELSPDGRFTALILGSGAVQVWDSTMEKEVARFEEAKDISFSPDSNVIVVATAGGVRIVDGTTLKEMATFKFDNVYQDNVRQESPSIKCTFSPNNRVVGYIMRPARTTSVLIESSCI